MPVSDVGADRREGGPVRQGRLANAGVHLLFDEHLAAGGHQQLGDEAQRLLGPRRQQYLPGGATDAPLAHQLDDALSERLVRLAVLQRGGVASQDLPQRRRVGVARYQLGRGKPAGERQEPGLRRQKRELPQARTGPSGTGGAGARRAPRTVEHGCRHCINEHNTLR